MSYTCRELHTILRRAKRNTRGQNTLGWAGRVLDRCNELMDAHGTEAVNTSTHTVAEYVNVGETYALTIMHDRTVGRFCVESLGDFIARKERARPCDNGFKAAIVHRGEEPTCREPSNEELRIEVLRILRATS